MALGPTDNGDLAPPSGQRVAAHAGVAPSSFGRAGSSPPVRLDAQLHGRTVGADSLVRRAAPLGACKLIGVEQNRRMFRNQAGRSARGKLIQQLKGHPAVLGVALVEAAHSDKGQALEVNLRYPPKDTDPVIPAEIDGFPVFIQVVAPISRNQPPNVDIGHSLPGTPNR